MNKDVKRLLLTISAITLFALMPSAVFANDHSVLSNEAAYRAHHPGETDTERKVAVEVTDEMMVKQKLMPEEISYNKYLSDNKIDQGVIPLTPADKKRAQDLMDQYRPLDEMYNAFYSGRISLADLQELERNFYAKVNPEIFNNPDATLSTSPEFIEQADDLKTLYLGNKMDSAFYFGPNTDFSILSLGDGQSKYLPMPYEYQKNSYYCGPATAVNIVNGRGGSMTQDQAARLLGTTTSGTSFGNNWLNVLNKTYVGKDYAVYSGNVSNWPSQLADVTIRSFLSGCGVALNTYMTPSTGYLEGYSGGTIGHYVPGYAFNSSDPSRRKISYIEVNNLSGFGGAKTVTYQKMAQVTKLRGVIA